MSNLDRDLETVQKEVQDSIKERQTREISQLELLLRKTSWEIHTNFGNVSRETLVKLAKEIDKHLANASERIKEGK